MVINQIVRARRSQRNNWKPMLIAKTFHSMRWVRRQEKELIEYLVNYLDSLLKFTPKLILSLSRILWLKIWKRERANSKSNQELIQSKSRRMDVADLPNILHHIILINEYITIMIYYNSIIITIECIEIIKIIQRYTRYRLFRKNRPTFS